MATKDCPRCGGTGEEPGAPFDDVAGKPLCGRCDGGGSVPDRGKTAWRRIQRTYRDVPTWRAMRNGFKLEVTQNDDATYRWTVSRRPAGHVSGDVTLMTGLHPTLVGAIGEAERGADDCRRLRSLLNDLKAVE